MKKNRLGKTLPCRFPLLTGAALTALLLTPLAAEGAPATPVPGENVQEMQAEKQAELENTSPEAAGSRGDARFHVEKISVEHPDMRLGEKRLQEIAAKYTGKDVTLSELSPLLEDLSRYCRRHNYPAATAYIPSQDVEGGNLKITILPGKLGKITIENDSSLKESVAERLLRGLHEGDIITAKKMETALYNVNGLEGVEAAGLLSPGTAVGTSDLTVKIKDGKKYQTTLYAENYGNRNTGRYRYGLQENINNLGGDGSQLRLGAIISNKDLRNYYIGYETTLGTKGTKLGLSVSHMDYEIGAALSAFGAEGKADTISLYGNTPFYRTSRNALSLTYGYDYRKLTDEYSRIPVADFKRQSHAFHVGLEGMERLPASALQYSANATFGTVHKDKDNIGIGRPSGGFIKGNAELAYLQQLGGPFDLLAKIQGQVASKALDSSEQMYLGGPRGVRAYQQGEASGDSGLFGSLELRYHTPLPGLALSAYVDSGSVYSRQASNTTSLRGWGLGLTYTKAGDWFARFDYARRMGLPDELENVSSAQSKQRMWFMVGKIW